PRPRPHPESRAHDRRPGRLGESGDTPSRRGNPIPHARPYVLGVKTPEKILNTERTEKRGENHASFANSLCSLWSFSVFSVLKLLVLLLVADIFRGALAIKRNDLELPLDRHVSRQETNLAVARLVFEVSLDRDLFTIRSQGAAEFGHGVYFHLLPDPKCSFKYRDALLDGRQIQDLCIWITCLSQLEIRKGIDYELYRFVSLCSRRIHMHVRREAHSGRQRDEVARNGHSVRLFHAELQVRGLDGIGDFFA